jgi:glycerophosphoryl diester phosphodiesterase
MTLIYAHRGASSTHPENTLSAFREAIRLGVAGIELDLRASADGVPVVIHDRDLLRTTNRPGNVDEVSLDQLRTYDAGGGEAIPTLRDVLDLVGDTVQIDLELKTGGIERAVLALLARYPQARWAISSFDWNVLREVRSLDPLAELWPLSEKWHAPLLSVARELASPTVALYAGAYTEASAAAIANAGLRAMIWTVNTTDEARRVRDLGAWALCTDTPARIAPALVRA